MTSAKETRTLRVRVDSKAGTLSLSEDGASVEGSFTSSGEPSHSLFLHAVPVYYVVSVKVEERSLRFAYLKREKKKHAVLVQDAYALEEADVAAAQEWCKVVMEAAYEGATAPRRLKVIVNPRSGKGKSIPIYNQTVQPILSLANCTFDTTFTERAKHATEIASTLPLDFDAVVILSGDGLLHEVYNGFAEHGDPLRAFAIPIAPVPTGSANGTCLNLFGLEDGFDAGLATLNAIKGKPMKQDICSVTIGEQRIFSYMTQAMGLMADVDLGTEHLRWMGDVRFVLGFIVGALKMKPFPMTLEIKTAETDKDKMLEEFRARSEAYQRQHEGAVKAGPEGELQTTKVDSEALPELQHTEEPLEDNGWIKFDKPVLYLYAGKSPWVSRDFMQFPVAHPSDGFIDVVAQEIIGRFEALSLMDGAEKGNTFFQNHQHYFKAHAYRVTPHPSPGKERTQWVSIDGEHYPLQPFAVECHRALGALLSPTPGAYAHEETFRAFEAQRRQQQQQARGKEPADGHGEDEPEEGQSMWKKLTGCC